MYTVLPNGIVPQKKKVPKIRLSQTIPSKFLLQEIPQVLRQIEIKLNLASPFLSKRFPSHLLLKKQAKAHKIFIIQGEYPALKNALISSGWEENPDSKSSNFQLLWAKSTKFPLKLEDWQMINHFPKNYEISAKWNLCENLKKFEKTAGVNCDLFYPRSYRLIGGEYEEFRNMFKLSKTIGLLKAFALVNGGVCYEKIVVALSVARRWINICEKGVSGITVQKEEWKILSSNSAYEVQVEFNKFGLNKTEVPAEEISRIVKATLERIDLIDPQYHISGSRNVWIVKPGRKSRGRGIKLFKNLEEIKEYTSIPQQWVVQKYIETPLLINKKKFDIRQWVLVSNIDPLTIWIYPHSYLRFTVEDYELQNLENNFIHLTNNSISKKSSKFKSKPNGCMWHIEQFIEYLDEKYSKDCWEKLLFPKIQNIVKMTIFSAGYLGRKNCFELFGYDFMIDSQLNPWLLEINSSPAMDYSTVIPT